MTDREMVQHITRTLAVDCPGKSLRVRITENATKVLLLDVFTGEALLMLPIGRKLRDEVEYGRKVDPHK